MTRTVKSADGSTIAYDTMGTGPVLIIVGGAFGTRQAAGAIASLLAAHFRVYAYDRRGRGGSTEATPYTDATSAVEREIEDLAALVEAADGSAMVYGHSSGAVLALEAAASGVRFTKVAAYEPPFTAEQPGNPSLEGWGESVRAAVDAGDRERAAVLFLEGTGADAATIEGIKQIPWWPGMLAIAHTLPYDLAVVGAGYVPVERFRKITAPTLVLHGGGSPAWAGTAASVVADAIPGARHMAIEGQDHGIDESVLAPVLIEFFG